MADPDTLQIKYSLGKYLDKGEDAWAQQPSSECTLAGAAGSLKIAFFGVFDGHGGKQAATFASRHLLPRLQAALAKSPDAPAEGGPQNPAGDAATAADDEKATALRAELVELGVSTETLAACDDADALTAALPGALSAAFTATEQDFSSHSQESGTTATVAVLVGWEVLLANVGDSLAFLDTGSEVIQISGNHRLDDSKVEQERILAAGAEVAQSEVDGKPVGPLRVWPGGLAMGRTIGDASAGSVATCEPEIRQVTLPHTGGRLLLASDGLWDMVSPKSALHHVRGLPASKAAAELIAMAKGTRKPRDDITALVIDAIPPGAPDARLPPLLAAKTGSGRAGASGEADAVDIAWPLTGEGSVHWRRDAWQRRLTIVKAQRQAAEQVAQAAAAAHTRRLQDEAAAAAAAVAAGHGSDDTSVAASDDSEGSVDEYPAPVVYASELHRQLATRAVEPSELEALGLGKQEAAVVAAAEQEGRREDDSWEAVPVKPRRKDAQAFRELAVPGYGAAQQQDRQQHGRGTGLQRGGRGGRGRDSQRNGRSRNAGRQGERGRGRADRKQHAAKGVQEQPAEGGVTVAGDDAGMAASDVGADSAAAGAAGGGAVEQLAAGPGGGAGQGRGRRGGRHQDFLAGRGDAPGGRGRGRGRRGGAEWQQQPARGGGRGRSRGRYGMQAESQADSTLSEAAPQAPKGSGKQPPSGPPPQQQQQQQRQGVPNGPFNAQQLFDAARGSAGDANGSSSKGRGRGRGRQGRGLSGRAGKPGGAAEGPRGGLQTGQANDFAPHLYRYEHPPPPPQQQQQQQQQQQHQAPPPREQADMGQLQFGTYTAKQAAPPALPQQPPQLQFGTVDFADHTQQQQQQPQQQRHQPHQQQRQQHHPQQQQQRQQQQQQPHQNGHHPRQQQPHQNGHHQSEASSAELAAILAVARAMGELSGDGLVKGFGQL